MTSRVPSYSYDPDTAWSILKIKQKVEKVEHLDPTTPKPPDHTRFVCISGTCVCVCLFVCYCVCVCDIPLCDIASFPGLP